MYKLHSERDPLDPTRQQWMVWDENAQRIIAVAASRNAATNIVITLNLSARRESLTQQQVTKLLSLFGRTIPRQLAAAVLDEALSVLNIETPDHVLTQAADHRGNVISLHRPACEGGEA
jgi:selenocysteine lyase/cysteine desulfurase